MRGGVLKCFRDPYTLPFLICTLDRRQPFHSSRLSLLRLRLYFLPQLFPLHFLRSSRRSLSSFGLIGHTARKMDVLL